MDRLMAEVGPRVHRMYYAAKAGNWPLAAYFSKSVVKQLQLAAFVPWRRYGGLVPSWV